MLRTCVIGIVLALAGTSCGKSDDKTKTTDKAAAKPQDDEGKADLDALAKLKDEMCACKDATCGKAVEEKLAAKRKEMEANYRDTHNKRMMQ